MNWSCSPCDQTLQDVQQSLIHFQIIRICFAFVFNTSSFFHQDLHSIDQLRCKIYLHALLTLVTTGSNYFCMDCYHVIYFTYSCVYKMCHTVFGNQLHRINAIRLFIHFFQVFKGSSFFKSWTSLLFIRIALIVVFSNIKNEDLWVRKKEEWSKQGFLTNRQHRYQ